MTKQEMLKKLVHAAGRVETYEAWHDDGELTDADIRVRKEWEDVVATAKEMGITDEEIKKCKTKGIYLYEKHYCGISKY